MSRVKKNRKAGSTAKKKTDNKSKVAKSDGIQYGKKRGKGLAPGSRQNEGGSGSGSGGASKDPRHGSKRKISLIAPKAEPVKVIKPKKVAVLSPEAELELLEQDPKLMTLLDNLDNEQSISAEDQQWLDIKMARHHQLLEELDLLDEDDDELDQGDLGDYLKEGDD